MTDQKKDASNAMWGGRFAAGPDAIMEAINASIGFDLNAITGMIQTIIDEDQVPVSTATWGAIKALYR